MQWLYADEGRKTAATRFRLLSVRNLFPRITCIYVHPYFSISLAVVAQFSRQSWIITVL